MGITGLLVLLKTIQKPCHLRAFAGLTVGVDVYGWLHRGCVSCSTELALDKRTTGYVDYAMKNVRMLQAFGIKPYIVFDGDMLPSKGGTEQRRELERQKSKNLGLELLKLKKHQEAYQEFRKAIDVTPEMAKLLINELKRSGVDYVVAPYEADAQLAYLEKRGFIQGILSEDSDLLVFGAQCLLTKLDMHGNCIMIQRKDFAACREVSFLGWTDSQFRQMAILGGCDYLANIPSIGLKKAHRLLRQYREAHKVIRALQMDAKLVVPAGYPDAFERAENTFLYQWVFCPAQKCLVNLESPRPDVDVDAMPYVGARMDADTALGIAMGDVNPITKERFPTSAATAMPLSSGLSSGLSSASQKASRIDNPKQSQTIEAFFKSRRPLAELDPNLFTPTPHQRQLQQRQQSSWPARPVSSQVRAAVGGRGMVPTRVISTANGPNLSRNVLQPSKRQKIEADTTADDPTQPQSEALQAIKMGMSRYFECKRDGADTVTARPPKLLPTDAAAGLWSDDSIDEPLMQLLQPVSRATGSRSSSFKVFVDDDAKHARKERKTQCAQHQASHPGGYSQAIKVHGQGRQSMPPRSRKGAEAARPASHIDDVADNASPPLLLSSRADDQSRTRANPSADQARLSQPATLTTKPHTGIAGDTRGVRTSNTIDAALDTPRRVRSHSTLSKLIINRDRQDSLGPISDDDEELPSNRLLPRRSLTGPAIAALDLSQFRFCPVRGS